MLKRGTCLLLVTSTGEIRLTPLRGDVVAFNVEAIIERDDASQTMRVVDLVIPEIEAMKDRLGMWAANHWDGVADVIEDWADVEEQP